MIPLLGGANGHQDRTTAVHIRAWCHGSMATRRARSSRRCRWSIMMIGVVVHMGTMICSAMRPSVNACNAQRRQRPSYYGIGTVKRQRQTFLVRPMKRERSCAQQPDPNDNTDRIQFFHDLLPSKCYDKTNRHSPRNGVLNNVDPFDFHYN